MEDEKNNAQVKELEEKAHKLAEETKQREVEMALKQKALEDAESMNRKAE